MIETETFYIQYLERFEKLFGPTERNWFVLTEENCFEKTNAIVNGDNF